MSRNHAGYAGRRWAKLCQAKLDSVGWRCERCGQAGKLEVHHRVHLEDGGAFWVGLSELEALCRNCHIDHHRRKRPMTAAMRRWHDYASELR